MTRLQYYSLERWSAHALELNLTIKKKFSSRKAYRTDNSIMGTFNTIDCRGYLLVEEGIVKTLS